MTQSQRKLLMAIAACLSALSATAASLSVNTTEPTGSQVIISIPHSPFTGTAPSIGPLGERDTFTTISTPAGGFGDRGQTFLMPTNVSGVFWDVSAITIRADATANGTGFAQDLSATPSTLKLWVFEWNPNTDSKVGTQWTAGNGSSDGDPFSGTGINNFLINGELFDITRAFNGEFLHFSTPGLQLTENRAYGALVSLTAGPTTGFRLDDVRDNVSPNGQVYPDGGIIRSDATVNAFNSNGDDIVFYVEAVAVVPEPGTVALFGIGILIIGIITCRRILSGLAEF
jgi:hypothetical protein